MLAFSDRPTERPARCTLCAALIYVPDGPADGWVCGDCTEQYEDRVPVLVDEARLNGGLSVDTEH